MYQLKWTEPWKQSEVRGGIAETDDRDRTENSDNWELAQSNFWATIPGSWRATSEIQKFFDFETRLGSKCPRCPWQGLIYDTSTTLVVIWVLRDTQRTRTECSAARINIIVYSQWRETATDNDRRVT